MPGEESLKRREGERTGRRKEGKEGDREGDREGGREGRNYSFSICRLALSFDAPSIPNQAIYHSAFTFTFCAVPEKIAYGFLRYFISQYMWVIQEALIPHTSFFLSLPPCF